MIIELQPRRRECFCYLGDCLHCRAKMRAEIEEILAESRADFDDVISEIKRERRDENMRRFLG